MLRELHIKNIAVIQEANVEFNNGFQVLTGETGAGKSILIDSINMALGGRGSRELIRAGAESAQVDLVFETENDTLLNEISDMGVECDDAIIMINRRITPDGKSKSYINGKLTPISVVKNIGEKLLTIHGQNDNQSILSPKSHMGFLDEYAENHEIVCEYKEQYKKVKKTEEELEELLKDEGEKDSLAEILSFQIDEINTAKLKIGEEEELNERRTFLQNSEAIAEGTGGAYYNLHGGDESGNGACDMISDAMRKLEGIKDFDPKLAEYYETLTAVMADVEDVTHSLYSYVDGVNYSPDELDRTENRLSLISTLERKYGATIEAVLEFGRKAEERLEKIEKSDEKKNELTELLASEKAVLKELAEKLTESRKNASLKLCKSIMSELADLDMQKIRFDVSIRQTEDSDGNIKCTSSGCDEVEFMISANPGEELKPLVKIASGGEMSRIMLAIKSVLSESDSTETMIFDEIDTGVSGRAAQKIAEKIGVLSRKRQILCITHLPQIAAMADFHYVIEKKVSDDSARTVVLPVEGEERNSEVARIIGGVQVTELTLNAAAEMLSMAATYKDELK